MLNIEERAFLVHLSISVWNGNATDKDVTQEVIDNKHATRGAGVMRKKLFAKEALIDINSAVSHSRKLHRNYTLPWDDQGKRIITNVGYADYAEKMRECRIHFQKCVKAFLEDYEEHRDKAKFLLGDMWKAEDYPSRELLKSKFDFEFYPEPIPTSNDFRVKFANSDAKQITDQLRADIEKHTASRLNNAVKDVWMRVYEVTNAMQTKLSEYKPKTSEKKAENNFTYSLVSHIQELADVLPMLNLNNDPELEKIQQELLAELCAADVDTLKGDKALRTATAKRAKEIAKKAKQYF